ncbi:MAG: hypothetical protein ACE5IF_03975 [Candidatus Bathyarchaeia archaeon]
MTMAAVAVLYLTSDEIWRMFDNEPFPEITREGIILYVAFFLPTTLTIHFVDIKRIVSSNAVAIGVLLSSLAIDIAFLGSSELAVLWATGTMPSEVLSVGALLLLGALPSSLGVVTLSSLTADVLKKRASELEREVKKLEKEAAELVAWETEARKRLRRFKKELREFEKDYKEEEDES